MQRHEADARTDRAEAAERMDRAQDSAYGVEHTGALVMALAAVVLGVLGALTGLAIIDLRDTDTAANVLPGVAAADEGVTSILSHNFWDGAMLLFAGINAAILAYCLHSNDHHRTRDLSTLPSMERGAWTTEHGAAYLFALVAIALTVIGLLTGFGTFGDQDQGRGLMWIWLGTGSSLLAMTLHAVRHHQAVADEDAIIAIVERRVNAAPGGMRQQPGSTQGRQSM